VQHESIIATLRGGWSLLREDPVGILLPAIVVIGLQAVGLALLQAWWRELSVTGLIGAVAAALLLRTVLAAPFRASYLASGARQLGRGFSITARTPALVVVWALAVAVEATVVGALLFATLGPAWWLLARSAWWTAVLLVTMTTLPILLVGVATRSLFAYAAIEATAGRQPAVRALSRGLRAATADAVGVLTVLVAGEAMVAAGGLLCGAGVLPGATYADLALLHRWASRQEA
jgi:hypothetical protein